MNEYNYVIDSLTLGAEASQSASAEEAAEAYTTTTTTAGGGGADISVVGGGQTSFQLKPYMERPRTYTANGTDPLSKQLRLKGFAHKGRKNHDGAALHNFYRMTGGAHQYTAQLYTYPENTAKYDTLIVDLPTWFSQAKNSAKTVEIECAQVYHRDEYKTKKVPKVDDEGNPVLDEEGNPVEVEEALPYEEQDPYVQLPCTCHSDLVQVNASADCCIGCSNLMYSFPKKYVIGNAVQSFNMWFRDMSGKIVDIDPYKTHLIVEVILRW